jgi:hypothetical protein
MVTLTEALAWQIPFVPVTVKVAGSACATANCEIKRKKENSSTLFRTIVFQLKKIFFILVILQLFCGLIKMMVRGFDLGI